MKEITSAEEREARASLIGKLAREISGLDVLGL